MEYLLSIITPVYNVESYLDRCLQSILSQSFRDYELILIDDGSTDKSASMCDDWAAKDDRILVIHQENRGVSAARNAGLEVVKGKYLTFVDPDDFIAPDTYSVNMEYLINHQAVDILQYPYCNYVNDTDIIDYHKPSSILLTGTEQIFRNWWSGSPLEYVIWNKIYKSCLWNDIRFHVGHISEDTCLVSQFVNRVTHVYLSDQGLYYYQRQRENSYTYGDYSFDKHMDLFYAHATIYECFKMFPKMTTEKVLAFTRLFRRLITAKQTEMSADISVPQKIIMEQFPTLHEIWTSQHTEKIWLSVAKILGVNFFMKFFLIYLRR